MRQRPVVQSAHGLAALRRRRDALSRAGAASSIDDDRPQDVVPVASLQTWTVSGSSSSPATLKALDSAPDMSSADVARHVEALLEGCSLDVVAAPPKLKMADVSVGDVLACRAALRWASNGSDILATVTALRKGKQPRRRTTGRRLLQVRRRRGCRGHGWCRVPSPDPSYPRSFQKQAERGAPQAQGALGRFPSQARPDPCGSCPDPSGITVDSSGSSHAPRSLHPCSANRVVGWGR